MIRQCFMILLSWALVSYRKRVNSYLKNAISFSFIDMEKKGNDQMIKIVALRLGE